MPTLLQLPEIRPLDDDQRKRRIKAAPVSAIPDDAKP